MSYLNIMKQPHKVIAGAGNYAIVMTGYVVNMNTGNVMAIRTTADGVLYSSIKRGGVSVPVRIRRELAIAFIPNPGGLKCTRVIDGDETNLVLSNIEWCAAGRFTDKQPRLADVDVLVHGHSSGYPAHYYSCSELAKDMKMTMCKLASVLKMSDVYPIGGQYTVGNEDIDIPEFTGTGGIYLYSSTDGSLLYMRDKVSLCYHTGLPELGVSADVEALRSIGYIYGRNKDAVLEGSERVPLPSESRVIAHRNTMAERSANVKLTAYTHDSVGSVAAITYLNHYA